MDQVPARIDFGGTRRELGGILLLGYLFMVPTLGLNRFWLTTRKRRFYWGHTQLGGDTLEYTGDARQLLVGFLMALAVFVPLYGLFFYLSTLSSEAAIIGYGAVALFLWLLYGYAIYRARDFRLSRTLWRGIRFDQRGSAWVYAFKRFFWSLLTLATLGLAYPFMAASLWSYRYRHSWYGDRQFAFTASWRNLILPYLLSWLAVSALVIVCLVLAETNGLLDDPVEGDPSRYAILALPLLCAFLIVTLYRSIEWTRMFSAMRLGAASVTVRVPFLAISGQYVLFALALALTYLLLAFGGFLILSMLAGEAVSGGSIDPDLLVRSMQSSVATLLAIVFGYLLLFGAFTLISELVLGFGFWRLVTRGATVTGLETLNDVQARDEDPALAGEGLADALNVGGY